MYITYMEGKTTTIVIEEKVKKRLKDLKIHPREPYNDVLKRILDKVEEGK